MSLTTNHFCIIFKLQILLDEKAGCIPLEERCLQTLCHTNFILSLTEFEKIPKCHKFSHITWQGTHLFVWEVRKILHAVA